MDKNSLTELCNAWIARYKNEANSVEGGELINYWAFEKLDDLARDNPEVAWKAILNILVTDSSDSIVANISAGPIENLLVFHGKKTIELIEGEARKNGLLKFALQGVYQNDISPEIWERLQKVI